MNWFRFFILSRLAWLLLWLLYKSWKIKIVFPKELLALLADKKPLVIAHWHGDELALLLPISLKLPLATITSTSKDGAIINYLLNKMGVLTSRGSSTRGAVTALKGLIRLGKSGRVISFAVDGPKGPIHEVKPGAFEVSRLLCAPLYTIAVATDKAWHFKKSWNQTYLPKPFAKIYIEVFASSLGTLTKEHSPQDKSLATCLKKELNAAKNHVGKKFAEDNARC